MNNKYTIENYEVLLQELFQIKNDLIKPNVKLSDSISKVKRSKELSKILNEILDEAEKEVKQITQVENNKLNNGHDVNNLASNVCTNYKIDDDDDIPF